MPNVNLSKETYDYLKAFLPVLEATTDEAYDVNRAAAILISYGINESLVALRGQQEKDQLLTIIQQLAARHSKQVFGYLAETMKPGAETHRREAARAWQEKLGRTINVLQPRPEGPDVG